MQLLKIRDAQAAREVMAVRIKVLLEEKLQLQSAAVEHQPTLITMHFAETKGRVKSSARQQITRREIRNSPVRHQLKAYPPRAITVRLVDPASVDHVRSALVVGERAGHTPRQPAPLVAAGLADQPWASEQFVVINAAERS